MTPEEESKIRKLLKASPTLTPPESLYRGVLNKVRRQVQEPEKSGDLGWLWGFPVKALATACLLLVMVFVAKESRRPEVELQKSVHQIPVAPASAPALANTHAQAVPLQKKELRAASPFVLQNAPVKQADDLSSGASPATLFPAASQLNASRGATAKAMGAPTAAAALDYGTGAPMGGLHELSTQKDFVIAGPAANLTVIQKVLPAALVSAPAPDYQGLVRIYFQVLPDGSVNPQVRITRTTGYPTFDQAAVDAIKKWQFAPAAPGSWGIISFQLKPKN